jgi:hypothetical protein
MMKQIRVESEPFGLTLRAHRDAQWFPTPQGINGISLMTYASGKYDKKSTMLLNKYRMHLQITSLYDMLLYNLSTIHPDILAGRHISSWISTIYWVEVLPPPKRAKELWKDFLTNHIIPYLNSMPRN